MLVETSDGLLDEIGSEALASGIYTSPTAVIQNIDSIATADIVNVSKCGHIHCLQNDSINDSICYAQL